MHDERQRQVRPRRLRRATDRVEDLVAWMLITLALFTAVVAATRAHRLYVAGMHRVDVETHERAQLQAVLLEPARDAIEVDDRGRGVRRVPVSVPVRYAALDGTEHRADAQVLGPLPAGAPVPIWVDRSGSITRAPLRGLDVVGSAATGAGGVLAVGAVVLGGLWLGVRWVVLRLNTARWAREWRQVEPQWSGRTQSS
jgi:hypothetical protein